nr:MAG TPA: hypothetical protein [Caudoviricetes sp.]
MVALWRFILPICYANIILCCRGKRPQRYENILNTIL